MAKGCKASVLQEEKSSEDLLCNSVAIVSNVVLYATNLVKEWALSTFTTEKEPKRDAE